MLFGRSRKEQGWLLIDESPDEVTFVHGVGAGERASIAAWARVGVAPAHGGLERIAKERHFERYQCATLLRPGEYQIMLVEAPSVPAAELKSAIRWRVKEMLDYPVDNATLDVLDIPPESADAARSHSMFAVAAKNELIESRMKRFEAARVPLRVIDIPETAQRNIAALYEDDNRAAALLFLERESALLTINFRGELYFARRFDAGFEQILKYAADARREVFGRIHLELQRTFDHFDRQHGFVSISKLLLGPEPEESGLAEFLRSNLELPVERVDLPQRLNVQAAAEAFDTPTQWRLFHLVGAALRQEARAA